MQGLRETSKQAYQKKQHEQYLKNKDLAQIKKTNVILRMIFVERLDLILAACEDSSIYVWGFDQDAVNILKNMKYEEKMKFKSKKSTTFRDEVNRDEKNNYLESFQLARTEIIRRKANSEAFGLTTQLIKKADGTKFGKTESGTIWLDKTKTSPYKFYQFWINTSDVDAKNFIKIFTFLSKNTIEELIMDHDKDPGKRVLQKALSKEITTTVHGQANYLSAIETSSILFNGNISDLFNLNEDTFLDVFDGVPQFNLNRKELEKEINVLDFLVEKTSIMPSKSEAKKLILGGGISINKVKTESHEYNISSAHLINNKYILIQKGKRNYYLCIVN